MMSFSATRNRLESADRLAGVTGGGATILPGMVKAKVLCDRLKSFTMEVAMMLFSLYFLQR